MVGESVSPPVLKSHLAGEIFREIEVEPTTAGAALRNSPAQSLWKRARVRLYSVSFVNLLIEYALFTFSQLSFLAATKTASVT
jgi:hypothetical protein